VLPVATEVVIEGAGHQFDGTLTKSSWERLRRLLDNQHQHWHAMDAKARRWAQISRTTRMTHSTPQHDQERTFYCPGSFWHYQVQLGAPPTKEEHKPQEAGSAEASKQEESMYRFCKDAAGGIWWSVALSRDVHNSKFTAELSLNTHLLWEQHQRMLAGKAHSFSLLIRDLLRNARSLVSVLHEDSHAEDPARTGCFYPGMLEPALTVQEHYAQKAIRRETDQSWASEKVRRFNNLVKVLLIERFVDTLPGPLRILDLGCGMGQDLQKYSRAFRTAHIESYVGIDFALEAIQEARRRYAKRSAAVDQRGVCCCVLRR